jgi:broad specificity phosphatase PhoE
MILGLLVAVVGIAFLLRATTTTIVLVRHAEKQLGTIDDPPLAPAGEERARRLAQLFGERTAPGRVEAIYATDTRRAQQTAAPLAARLGVGVIALSADASSASLARRVRREHRGGVALVVGHGNTVPELVRALAPDVAPPAMADEDYGAVYVVTVPDVGRSSVLRLSY